MEITFLGTGTSTGIPVICCHCEVCTSDDPRDNRTRTSAYVQTPEINFVIDTGPDFREQLLREGIEDIDAVLYTHSHKDHIAGLDDIRPINYFKGKTIEVYASEGTLKRLRQEYAYVFANDYPGVPQILVHEIKERYLDLNGLQVEVLHAMHGQMPVLGFRIKDFVYLTDINFMEPEEMARLRDVDTLVLNAIHHRPHYSHFNLEEALAFIKQVNPKNTYLIHFSHQMGKHADVEAGLPDNVGVSYDGLKLQFDD